MGLQKFGDWDIVLNMAKNLGQDIITANRKALARLAARTEAIAVKHLRDQDLNWKALSPRYLAWKAKKGLSTKTLIATSTYMQSVTSKATQNVAMAGVFRQSRTKDGKQAVGDIAKIMEYGSIKRNIPARRLWRPVYNEMITFIKKEKLFPAATLEEINKRTGK